MTENAIFGPARNPLTIALLVLAEASILQVASTLDPLRNANRQLGYEAFRWRVVSRDGGPVPLTCGLSLPSSGPLRAAAGADALFIVAGFHQDAVAPPALIRDLHRMAVRFALIGGVDSGPWIMARAGLLDGYRATVHWEDLEDMAARHPAIEVVPDRYVIDRGRVTIGGAGPAADFMLHLIRCRHGAPLARQVAMSFQTIQTPGAVPQIASSLREPGLDPRVAAAAARMEARIDAPETAASTARAVGLSPRQMEKLFRTDFGTTPGAYALNLRLQAARRLLTDTRHPLVEVALRTGFTSPATLSRAFRNAFGIPPGSLRRG